jgi:hypothetical protein
MKRVACVTVFLLLAACLAWPQGAPRLTGVTPDTAKAGDTVTATGENLGKGSVVAIFLSDADKDYKVQVIEQTPEKIVFKVAQVKPASYNVSIQVRNEIFIQPVRLTVQ